jgi:ATP-dependent RNA helicase DDX46/PRP5
MTQEEKEAEQKQLEEEMRKRRERVEAWRAARRTTEKQEMGEASETTETDGDGEKPQKKGWTLDDDEDDDEDMENGVVGNKDGENGEEMEDAMETEEVDPLDAFMAGMEKTQTVQEKSEKKKNPAAETQVVKTTVITATRTQPSKPATVKGGRGELMEVNPDAMEYSSEEETPDLATTIASLGPKPKKKELPVVDHAKVQYTSFRKNFYVEVPELTKLTDEEVNALREDSENIKVKGKNCPKPIKTWAQSGVSSKVLDILRKNSYEKPTPIQSQAIPACMSGQDLIGIAKTGSGKTLAFLLPMFRHVLDQSSLDPGDGPIALIMAPTRELAIQIYNECRKFCKVLKLRTVCVYGGTGISEQIADLKRGGEIVVCTPGRMIDMLAANNGNLGVG